MKWEKLRLSSITTTLESGSRPKGGAVLSGIPSLGAEHLDGTGGFKFNKLKYVPKNYYSQMASGIIRPNDILIVKDGATTGKVSIVDHTFPFLEASINEHVFLLRVDPQKCNSKYCFYYLSSDEGQKELMADFRGATVGGISRNILTLIKVPLPPLQIQEQIADTLDKADALRRKEQELLQQYDQLAQAIFYDMFGDPKKWFVKWEKKKLGEVCDKITDGEHGTVERLDQGRLYLMARNIRDNYIDLSEVSYISDKDHHKIFKRCNPETGDLLLVCVGATIGRVSIVPPMEEFSLARSVALVKPNREILESAFLYSLFKSDYMQKQIVNSGNSSAQAGLYTGKINDLIIFLPPLSLQQTFSKKLNHIQNIKVNTNSSQNKTANIFNGLLVEFFS